MEDAIAIDLMLVEPHARSLQLVNQFGKQKERERERNKTKMNSCSNIVNVMGQDDVSSFDLREIVGFIFVCGQRPKDLVIT